MSSDKTQRIRDPVHGLIVFRKDKPIDMLAWKLIDTPEFQRLRRVKQLGVAEFVFPGATHTRFAHCIGVFHTARTLIEIIKREASAIKEVFDERRAEVAVIAALLHDLGHGPFSHTFEEVCKSQNIKKRHETWTAEIIRNPDGSIKKLLDDGFRKGFCKEVAELLASENPKDIYHAVVSSSFDADRLDYLRRDRLMTGTGAGAIDFDWLMEHVRIAVVNLEAADIDPAVDGGHIDTGPQAPTFCIDIKALPAAEQFLLSRFTLHEQVYFHKTTRCVEHMIAELLKCVANRAKRPSTSTKMTGLEKTHPLLRFFGKDGLSLDAYLALDDAVVTSALERMVLAEDPEISVLAKRLRNRRLYKTLDTLRASRSDEGSQRRKVRQIDQKIGEKKFKDVVLKDEGASLSIYSQIGGDDERAHKKLRILDADGKAREISHLSKIIEELEQKRQLTRYYFASESDRALAQGAQDNSHERKGRKNGK